MIWIAIIPLLLGAAGAGGGGNLPPAATVANDTGAPLYVVLPLQPGDSFTNTTDRTFTVLDALELRSLADLRIEEHEDAIARLEARLAELDRSLTTYRAARTGEAP